MDEFYLNLGPLQILRVGCVWSIDLFRLRIYGVGKRIRVTIARADGA